MIADSTETDMMVPREGEIGMNLIGYNVDVMTIANIGNLFERFCPPNRASGIVGIAQNHPAALAGTPFKVVEIYCKTTVDHMEWTCNQLTGAVFGQVKERRINGGGNKNAITRLGHGLQHKCYSCHDARDIM